MQHAIITGASRGIGSACAQHFLEQGWKVINLSRHANPLPSINNITIDLSDNHWQQQHAATILEQVNKASKICLIHNAAILENDTIQNINCDHLQRSLDISITAAVQLNQLLIPSMQAGSSIIYMGSTLSEKAVKNTASYTITKHAVIGMMRASCQDLDDTGIHTSCICPGFTDTEMLRDRIGNQPETLEYIKRMVCQRRLIQPTEIAELVYFCAQHPVVNGSVLHANLGQVER